MRAVCRSRQPIIVDNVLAGYADFWTGDEARAREEASKVSGRIFERLTVDDIEALPPAQRLRAMAAYNNAFPDSE